MFGIYNATRPLLQRHNEMETFSAEVPSSSFLGQGCHTVTTTTPFTKTSNALAPQHALRTHRGQLAE